MSIIYTATLSGLGEGSIFPSKMLDSGVTSLIKFSHLEPSNHVVYHVSYFLRIIPISKLLNLIPRIPLFELLNEDCNSARNQSNI